jgi:hypothetical protein
MTVYTTAPLNTPGTHALVIGVSSYVHLSGGAQPSEFGLDLEMIQLTSAARSASEFAAWLIDSYRNPSAPLCSVRLLLSPNLEEKEEINPRIKSILTNNYDATRQNVEKYFKEFTEALSLSTENVGVIYVAGHGVQLTKAGAILLLHDIADPDHPTELHGAIDLINLHASTDHPEIAQKQFWFADICRQPPSIAYKFESMTGAMKRSTKKGNAKSSTMFMSSISGAKAYGNPHGVTLFNEALMKGLALGEAAQSDGEDESAWEISATSLIEYLSATVSGLAKASGAEQFVENTGIIENAVLHVLDTVPTVEFEADVTPQGQRHHCTNFNLKSATFTHIENNSTWPVSNSVPAGIYSAAWATSLSGTTLLREKLLNLRPPKRSLELKP